jgi:hypothetical protein
LVEVEGEDINGLWNDDIEDFDDDILIVKVILEKSIKKDPFPVPFASHEVSSTIEINHTGLGQFVEWEESWVCLSRQVVGLDIDLQNGVQGNKGTGVDQVDV